ncbi:hypothetical protein BDV29DRAFT_178720 [Aspergillus leporis]|uniref:Uncharacterized protein n=1 Tax=Aspergillus leporis TaxID=41062 RepID=A0A5N5WWW3_9EURO|nr:hypothetical protein BDV29DRAFT_178720 [Aspergillus leporis]
MARPFQNPYEPVNSPGSDSPLSPYPRGGTPISFKTNVNRSKTKRWVEAKKISYDGNDWGDDDFDEYDEEEPPPPVPQPQSLNQSTGDLPSAASRNVPRPWLSSMDRSRSMDMVATLGTGSAGDSRSRSVDRNAPEQDQTLPMRPADIYQRLRGEQTAGPGHARGLSRSTTEPISMAVPAGKEAIGDRTPTERAQPESQSVTLRARDDVPVIGLPDVKRLSGFDVGLTTAPDTSAQNDQLPEPQQQEHQLHHEPSIGFRSVVHQAFDVPETPTTTIDSIARSDSNSTSLISPIIPQRGSTEKTPTIEEEPESTSPPRNFIPGHRRDLSIPSPNNSPLRRPIIMNNDTIAPETLAEMSSDSPVDLSQGHSTLPYQQPSVPATTTAAEDRPAPLKIGSMSAGPGENPIPVIVPSLSTENSPQDTDNDRLRKEIIRSLSRENTPSEGHEEQSGSRPQTSRQDSLIPSEYERYWNEAGGASPQDEFKPVLGHDHTQNASQDLYSGSPLQESPASNAAPQRDTTPKLKRRFSWESASSEEQPTQEQPTQEQPAPTATVQSPSVVQSPPVGPIPGQFPTFDESSTQPDLVTLPPRAEPQEEEAAERGSGPEKPKLTIIPPSATDSSSIISDRHLPEVVNAQIVGDAYSPAVAEQRTPAPAPTQSPSIESSLLGFREIMEMKTSDERVQAFNKTRDQFVTIDTGLNNWLRVTIHAHPEYTDVVQRSLKPSTDELKLPVSRNKFPKLSSLGNLVSSHQDGSSSGTGHVRRPSAPLGSMMNKQHVEQRGKEFLHTAGVFGGKAGEAAKGLFAKGRSKFKGGGGSDKVEP